MEIGSLDVEGYHVGIGDLDTFFVGPRIEFALHLQAGLGFGRADQFEDDLTRDQRFAVPILGDVANQAMFSSTSMCRADSDDLR
jgi:hypothetical protein